MRSTICLGCGEPTSNVGGRCARCAGGLRRTRGGDRYSDPRYRRLRDRLLARHRATFGARCPRCLRDEDRGVRSTWLTLNHRVTMSAPGSDILGPVDVMCLGCNDRQLHVDRPDLSRARRAPR